MKIRLYAGLPGAASFNPLLPEGDAGTSGASNGGAGAPPATPPAAPPASPTSPAAGAPPADGPNGFPESTPVAEMTDAQRASYYAHFNRRDRAELERVTAELAALKPMADQYAALAEASKTEQERAIEAARTEAAAATRAEVEAAVQARYAPVLVESALTAALTGRMDAAGVKALMPTLNVPALLGSDGLPDAEKIAAFAGAIPAPAAAPVPGPPADLGGGRRTPVTPGGTQAGADLYAQRHKTKTS